MEGGGEKKERKMQIRFFKASSPETQRQLWLIDINFWLQRFNMSKCQVFTQE